MEVLISIGMFIGYLVYKEHQIGKERVQLIRELSISLKSSGIEDYRESIPEDLDDRIVLEEDELVDISEIDPATLLKSLK